jgi:hypothetical protein
MWCISIISPSFKAFAMPFEEFAARYGKTYEVNSTEWTQRSAIYAANLAKIQSHNADASNTFFLAVNQVFLMVFLLLIWYF